MLNIIDKYVYREFIPPFIVSTLFFTVLFLLQRLEKLSEMAFEKNVPVPVVLELLFYTIPFTVAITIPMGTLFGTLFSFGRLAQDSEIIVLRSSGVSLYRIFRPVLILGVLITSFLFYFMNYVMTETNLRYKSIFINILYSNPGVVMTPKYFTSFADGYQKITAMKIMEGGGLEYVYLYDIDPRSKNVKMIYARQGRWINNSFNTTQLSLNLFDGEIIQFNQSDRNVIDRIKFEKIAVNVINNIRSIELANQGLREMSFIKVRELIQSQLTHQQNVHPYVYIEYHRKFTIPLACIAFIVISIPLTVNIRHQNKGAGLGLSLVIVLIYYSLMTTFEAMGKKEVVNPQLALHLPNIIFGITSIILLFIYSRK